MVELSLNETLARLGYTTTPAGFGKKHIVQDGRTVFTGNAGEVWDWLANLENERKLKQRAG